MVDAPSQLTTAEAANVAAPLLQEQYLKYLYNNTLNVAENKQAELICNGANCYGLSVILCEQLKKAGLAAKVVPCKKLIKIVPHDKMNHFVVFVDCCDGYLVCETSASTPQPIQYIFPSVGPSPEACGYVATFGFEEGMECIQLSRRNKKQEMELRCNCYHKLELTETIIDQILEYVNGFPIRIVSKRRRNGTPHALLIFDTVKGTLTYCSGNYKKELSVDEDVEHDEVYRNAFELDSAQWDELLRRFQSIGNVQM
ncbi:hypothetical protein QOT17_016180 [Balamuthia mandrillaris]